MDYSTLPLIISTLLGVPVFTPFIAKSIYLNPVFIKKPAYYGAVLFIVAVVVCMFFSVSFISFFANIFILCLAYVCFGFLAFSLYSIKPKVIGIILGLLFTIPLVLGILLSTIGILGLLFIVDDFNVDYETQVSSELKCQVLYTGNATAAGGQDVRLFKHVISGIERRVARKYYTDTSKELYISDQHACQSLAEEHRSAINR